MPLVFLTPIGGSIRNGHVSRRIVGKQCIDHPHDDGDIDPPYERTLDTGTRVRQYARQGVDFFIHAFGLEAGFRRQPVHFFIISERGRP